MGIFDKAKEALSTDKLEELSDSLLEKGAEAAKKVLGEEHAEKIDGVVDSIDEKIGE